VVADQPESVSVRRLREPVLGVSLATLGEISKDGAVMQDNFHSYQLTPWMMHPRNQSSSDAYDDFNTPLGGVGEPGLPPIAPALCNAIFAATGQLFVNYQPTSYKRLNDFLYGRIQFRIIT